MKKSEEKVRKNDIPTDSLAFGMDLEQFLTIKQGRAVRQRRKWEKVPMCPWIYRFSIEIHLFFKKKIAKLVWKTKIHHKMKNTKKGEIYAPKSYFMEFETVRNSLLNIIESIIIGLHPLAHFHIWIWSNLHGLLSLAIAITIVTTNTFEEDRCLFNPWATKRFQVVNRYL